MVYQKMEDTGNNRSGRTWQKKGKLPAKRSSSYDTDTSENPKKIPTRNKRPTDRKKAARRTLDIEGKINRVTAEVEALIEECKRRREDFVKELLLPWTGTRIPADGSRGTGSPVVHDSKAILQKASSHTLKQCDRLLQVYDGFNRSVGSEKLDVGIEELWRKDAENMALLLNRGLTLGQNLVETLMNPELHLRHRAPGTDQEKEMDEMAIELFDEDIGMEESWGHVARDQVMQWSRLLIGG